jgi:hypothetical protein
MAPKSAARKEDEHATSDKGLTPEAVRTAALHLLELAAAFEGRGMIVGNAGADDQAALAEAVRALLGHRAGQRRRQRDGTLASLVRAISEDYRHFLRNENESALWLQERVTELSRQLGFQLNDGDLDALVVERSSDDELAITGGINQGPVVTAEKALAKAVNRSERTIAKARSAAQGLHPSVLFVRHAFGRWVPLEIVHAYTRELLESQRSARATGLSGLGELQEESGVPLDRAVERAMRLMFTTKDALREALETPPQGPAQAAFQQLFRATIVSYYDAARGFATDLNGLLRENGIVGQVAVVRIAVAMMRVPALGQAVDMATRDLVVAQLTGSDQEIAAAESALMEAARSELIADACRRFSDMLSPP